MNANQRREKILAQLHNALGPISASQLAQKYDVSRQIIVGDIALLRANDHDIIATNRGYLLAEKTNQSSEQFIGKIKSQHTNSQTIDEIRCIILNGGEILDVSVEHPVYGILTAPLNIATYADMEAYLEEMQKFDRPFLSSLTGGVHTHTVVCESEDHFDVIIQKLHMENFITVME